MNPSGFCRQLIRASRGRGPVLAGALFLSTAAPAAAQQLGYRIAANSVIVDQPSHWKRWTVPTHAMDITDEGVAPHFSRGRFNIMDDVNTYRRRLIPGSAAVVDLSERTKGRAAVLNTDSTETLDVKGNVIRINDKPAYTYYATIGISRVGSNPESASNVLDGDPTTYWEPEFDDPPEQWWIEIDLGRIVPVDELVLHFADEEVGDPFLQFRALISPYQQVIQGFADEIPFVPVGGTKGPNRDQRTFRFALEQFRADPVWRGKLVETIRIVVTDSDRGRGHLLAAKEEYDAQSTDDKGDIVYHIRNQQGFEEPVSAQDYEALPADRQGRIDYYRRERPRLAEVEAWGWGDNLSPNLLESGGSAGFFGKQDAFSPAPAFDGDYTSNFIHLVWSPVVERGVMIVDMGATFWLDATRISSTPPRLLIDGYIVRASDGSLDASGQLKLRTISPTAREDNLVDQYQHIMDVYEDPPQVRYLEWKIVSEDPGRRGGYTAGPNVAEYMLFSSGYPADAQMTSGLIELPNAQSFGGIRWDAEIPPGTQVEIRTRTGDVLQKQIRYFDRGGTQVEGSVWKNLFGSFKGPVDTSFVPASGWSSWSRAYRQSGDRVTSPGLRDYLQVQVRMTTTDRNVAPSLRSLQIELLQPVAEKILAEVTPATVPSAGVMDTFEVFVSPRFVESPLASRSVGFDELRAVVSAGDEMELIGLDIGVDPVTGEAQQAFASTDEAGVYATATGERLSVLRDSGDTLWVRTPRSVNILPAGEVGRIYNRITAQGDEVPVTQDDIPISGASYGVLPSEQQGQILYFRRITSGDEEELVKIDARSWRDLPAEEQGPVRYFRVLTGDGAPYPFDADGDSLDAADYLSLPSTSRGRVVGKGPLMRLRFRSPVFVNGTTLEMAVRSTNGGTNANAPWQSVEPGDALDTLESNTLSIGVPLESQALSDVDLAPNPFTPNGDGVNDAMEIRFSVLRLSQPRSAMVRIYTLGGRRVWQIEGLVESGRHVLRWDGLDDAGNLVPPGLYICQLNLRLDSDGGVTRSRTVAVVY